MRKLAFFACASVLAGVVMFVGHSASARLPYWAQAGFHHHKSWHGPAVGPEFVERSWPRVIPARFVVRPSPVVNGPFYSGPVVSRSAESGPFYSQPFEPPPVRLSAYQPAMTPPLNAQPMLSQAAWQVSQIAARNGDRVFLMMDKTRGKLFLFANGVPIFAAPALTGASQADQLPPDALGKTVAQGSDLRYRVTPAGRFTVSPGHDYSYGDTLDINEIKGRGWIIAIHLAPNASRDARLHTPGAEDKHVTEGCINVTADTIHQLVRLLSGRTRTALYILPTDDREISRFF
jgi:hypothetical protein